MSTPAPQWTQHVECGTAEAGAIYGERGPADPYRYVLWRYWGGSAPLFVPPPKRTVAFVMLNPSTATHLKLDPTVTRCVGFARSLGFNHLVVLNLFALRSTDPKRLARATDPVGPLNDEMLEKHLAPAEMVLCAWGNGGALHHRGRRVLALIRRIGKTPRALAWTRSGEPGHPLYLPALAQPQDFPAFSTSLAGLCAGCGSDLTEGGESFKGLCAECARDAGHQVPREPGQEG